jgi:hypothetical protein
VLGEKDRRKETTLIERKHQRLRKGTGRESEKERGREKVE